MTPIPPKLPDLPPLDLLEHPAAAAEAWRAVYVDMLIARRQDAAVEVWRSCRPAPRLVGFDLLPQPKLEPLPVSPLLPQE